MQRTGRTRDVFDKYYTSPEVVNICMDIVRNNVSFGEHDLVLEPSAGAGAFICAIRALSENARFFDIEPAHSDIEHLNFLDCNHAGLKEGFENVHVIGNPPFGRQSSLAGAFVRKACMFCTTISFILPKSFKKMFFQRAFSPYFHLVAQTDLPKNAFIVNGAAHNVPCVFQVWERRAIPRNIPEKMVPISFVFTKKEDSPDISVRRVGANAGTVDTHISNKNVHSHYFLRFTNGAPIDTNIAWIQRMTFEFDNMVGPKSISKQELISRANILSPAI